MRFEIKNKSHHRAGLFQLVSLSIIPFGYLLFLTRYINILSFPYFNYFGGTNFMSTWTKLGYTHYYLMITLVTDSEHLYLV